MRAVIYARYSAGSEQTYQSIEGQLRVCKKYIKDNGWDFVGLYADEHITGRTDQRPEFQKMINSAEAHEFDVLVVYSTDRFSRSKYDSAIYKKKLRECGVQIRYAAENIPEGPEGILLESLMEGWAQYYSEELSRKIKRGMHDTALKAKATGGTPIFGYTKGPEGTYIIVEKEADAVRQVFKMVHEGSTITDAMNYLNNAGYRTVKNNKFNISGVSRLLANKRYIGVYQYADVVIENGMPAIVDKQTFYQVQEKLGMNTPKPRNKNKYALSGKLFCGVCGNPMSGASGTSKTGDKHYYYRCRKNKDIDAVPADALESFIAEETIRLFTSPQELDSLVEKLFIYQGKKNAPEVKISDLEANLSKITQKREKLLDLIAETGDKRLLGKLDELDKDEVKAKQVIEEAKEKERKQTFSKDQLRSSLDVFFRGFDWDTPEKTWKRIIDALVSRVEIYPDKILIFYNILGPDGEPKKTQKPEFDLTSDNSTIVEVRRTLIVNGYICLVLNREKAI